MSKTPTPLAVEQWPIDRPQPYGQNARKIPDSAVRKVAASIREFGWRQPLVCAPDGVVIAGHTRLLAARSLGLSHVPVHIMDASPEKIRAYRLMDNRSHDEASWDIDILKLELPALQGLGLDLSLTGFDLPELASFLTAAPDVEFPEYDENAAVDVKYVECPACKNKFPR